MVQKPFTVLSSSFRAPVKGRIGKPVWVAQAIAGGELCVSRPIKFFWEMQKNNFQYSEDRDFFINFLAGGDEEKFEREYTAYFDFRAPLLKREEFNKIRSQVFRELVRARGLKCRLRIHPDCSKISTFQVDHIVPLATNELNKRLGHMKSQASKKVPAQSFGSNNLENLIITCARCNAYKKHRLIKPTQ